GIRSEVIAFDKAVAVAKEFADKNADTVVIVASDHGTGGMTFGNNNIASGYDKAPLESFTHIIKNAKYSGVKYAEELKDDFSNAKELAKEYYNIDLTDEELQVIKESEYVPMDIGHIISNRSNIGWTTGGHVGGDVGLYVYTNDKNVKKLSGTVHNNEIGRYMESIMDLDLDKLTSELYLPARAAFEKEGAEIEFVYDKDTNHQLIVKKGDKTITLPISKSFALVDGKEVDLGGLTIYNTESVYVPQGALELVK
ncbi:MAG: alkaline phosphatase, partial [Bacillota bacterium]|nr:alkaline phosphatase [Bacillota bacterium]